MLFRELALIVKPIDKKVREEMGKVFDAGMPEKHYMDKISDLEHRLYRAESILNKIVMKSKYVKWNKRDNTYILSNIKIDSYLLDLENIQNNGTYLILMMALLGQLLNLLRQKEILII